MAKKNEKKIESTLETLREISEDSSAIDLSEIQAENLIDDDSEDGEGGELENHCPNLGGWELLVNVNLDHTLYLAGKIFNKLPEGMPLQFVKEI